MIPGAAFYCVADSGYFLGAVGLVNSLRLHGHREPIFLLDAGLTAEQRELLAGEVELVDGSAAREPWLAKTVAPVGHPAEVAVLIDADMIVTRPFGDLLAAATGGVIAFENESPRFVADWGELLGLGPTRRRPYVTSGLVLFGGEAGREALALFHRKNPVVEFDRTFWRRNEPGYPFLYADQDVLNGVLASDVAPDRVRTLPARLAPTPPYGGLRVTDAGAVRCAHPDGTEPYVLHQFVRKPWLEPMYHGVYSRLLARLLLGEDVAVRVPPAMVPRRMRTGPLARVERTAVNAYDLGRWYLGERLPAWRARRRDPGGAA